MLLLYIEACICFVFTIFLYYRYSMRKLRLYVVLLNIIVWFLTFLTAVLVPFDIYYNAKDEKSGGQDPQIKNDLFILQIIYLVNYWLIYFLSWVIIPVAQEYEKAGDFTVKDKLKRAIKTNLYIYLIFLILGIIFILYLVVKQQLTGQKLLAFLVALSNAWGIFLTIFLLGYGLVAVPKQIIHNSDYRNRVHYLEYLAADCRENLESKNVELINCAQKIKSVRSILESESSNPNRGFVEKIWLDLSYLIPQDTIVEEELKMYYKKFTYEELTNLNTDIRKNKYDIIKLKCELEDIYQEWYYLNTLLGNINEHDYERNMWTRALKIYYLNVKPWLMRVLAFFLILLSLAIVLSEITLFTNLPLSIFGFLIEHSDNIYMLNALCLTPLIFMFLTSLYGLFQMKLYGYYSVHDNRQTDSVSLLFLSSFMCRIGFPLSLNFVQILKLKHLKTNIEWIMGETPDFGRNFMIFFPTILIVLCLFNLLDIYQRIMNILGFNTFGFKSPQSDDRVEEGNEILNKSIFI